ITPDPDHVGDLPGALAVEQAVGRLTGLVMVPPKTVQTYRYRVDIDECTTELDAKDPHLARLTAVWRVKFSDGDGSLKLDPQAEGERLRALAAGCNDPKTTVVGPVSVDEKTGEYCVPISRTARVEKEADISALSLFINVPARPVEGGMAIHLAEMTGSPYPRSWYWNR
ncbi:MAG: hypothetical protein KGH63_03965, partial [Candidatus Micrarchaeota archaeon]|nr:hypothetical protein [Candidatus Micrarchaeota archaeon]